MEEWILPVLVVFLAVIFTLLSICFIKKFCCLKKPNQPPPETLQNGIARLHHVSSSFHPQLIDFNGNNKKRMNYYVFRRGLSSKPLFSWSDNPSLVTDAVENGWSRFAFTNYASSPSVRSASRSILGSCGTGDTGDDRMEVEISWEVCQGSADFMQKIRLNSGLKKIVLNNSSTMAAVSVIKSALPLPGPPLGNSSSFPQEAYFEITILSTYDDFGNEENSGNLVEKVKTDKKVEGEKIKLIQESPNEKTKSESLIHGSNGNSHLVEELRHGSVKEQRVVGKGGVATFSMGLTGGGSLPLKFPGSYAGSIAFNSNGAVFLDGMKIVFESEEGEWGRRDKVIGCGYNPSQKRVFFTVDSQLIHEIHCKTEDFGSPLYPTLAATTEIMVLVNFGQSVFKYAQANLCRTPNPCFIGPMANSPALGYEDSKELFSMGRIDSHWLDRSTARSLMLHNPSNNNNNRSGADFDDVSSEADLFEIVLDRRSTGRSPHTPL